ncbi:hypothetical protein MKX03_015712 [Papaver bracteatum]|nr:hypothetical protein MKX03_015712 [Papaver bracteatum]
MMDLLKLQTEYAGVVSINLFVTLLCACIVIGHLLEDNRWMNESITAIAIGLCTGFVILLTTGGKSSHLLMFSEDLFFIYLLPPIIFNAGFMKIMLFGAVGTFLSFLIVSVGAAQIFKKMDIGGLELGDYLAIGTIFSATDSVCTLQVLNQNETPFLYSLVFGEGVVNDATSVVLFNAIQSFDLSHISSTTALQLLGNFLYLFIISTLLGVFAGLLSAYIIKKLYFGRHSTDREVAIMILMAYLSYMMAELFELSAILTVFFCGIVMSHYTWHNVTDNSRITTKHTFATMSFIAEIFIFLYVGMDALDIERWKVVSTSPGKSIGVSAILLGLAGVGRAASVFPLSYLNNLTKKAPEDKINIKQQVIIWWAGLIRGAVSVALAYKQFAREGYNQTQGTAMMITSTISVVLFTTVVFGLLTKPLIILLIPQKKLARNLSFGPTTPNFETPESTLTFPLLVNEQNFESGQREVGTQNVVIDQREAVSQNGPRQPILERQPSQPSTVHHYWHKYDDSFMRPMFGGRGFTQPIPGEPIGPMEGKSQNRPRQPILERQPSQPSTVHHYCHKYDDSFMRPMFGGRGFTQQVTDEPIDQMEVESQNGHRQPRLERQRSATSAVHHYWHMYDDSFMRPMFGGRGFTQQVPDEPIDQMEVESQNGLGQPRLERQRSATSTVHHYWHMYDDSFMRPMFGGRGFTQPVPGEPNDQMQGERQNGPRQPSATSTVHHYWRMFDDSLMRPMFGGQGFTQPVPGEPNDQMQGERQHGPRKPSATSTVHHYWRMFDDSFMRPMFGGQGITQPVPGEPIDPSATVRRPESP